MKNRLTNRSAANELVKLKKSVQFIQEVVQSYAEALFDHVGFSCALAISKAEELRERVSPFCPAYVMFGDLIEALKELYSGNHVVCKRAEDQLAAINKYFNLDQYVLIRRKEDQSEPAVPNC